MSTTSVCVVGSGSWGSALAVLLHRNGHEVCLWGRDATLMASIADHRENARYLPGVAIAPEVLTTTDLGSSIDRSEVVLIAVPSHAFSTVLDAVRDVGLGKKYLVWATKGFDPQTGQLLHSVVRDRFGTETRMGVLSGPTFAGEVARGLPAAVTLGAPDKTTAEHLAAVFRNPRLRVYASDDLPGVQVGGGVKNVLALAAGIADGLGFGANTRAALITRGLAELSRLGAALGGRAETLMGLSGLGDLVLTCTDNQSRNRRAGLIIGAGGSVRSAQQEIGQVVEGIAAAREVRRMSQRLRVEMPICEQVNQVVYDGRSPESAVEALLSRTPGAE